MAADAELFHTPVGDPYATVVVAEHRETHPVHSRAFRNWLRRRYWEAYGQVANRSALTDALETLAARAEFGGEVHEVYVRVAGHNGRVYVDLANDAWQAVEIGQHGWHVVESPPREVPPPGNNGAATAARARWVARPPAAVREHRR